MEFTDTLSLDISTVVPSISGPKRPQDKVLLTESSIYFAKFYKENTKREKPIQADVAGADYTISDGDVVIAAITISPSVILKSAPETSA